MKKRSISSRVGLCGLSALLLLPSAALAGKLSSQKIKPKMDYKISICESPKAPKIKANTVAGYEAVAAAFKTYLAAQQKYADCVEKEARSDLRTLQEVIFTGGQEAIAGAQRDIDAHKAELDALRMRLQDKTQ